MAFDRATKNQIAAVMLLRGDLGQKFEALDYLGMPAEPVLCTHTITGHRALVRPHPKNATLVEAQFTPLWHPHAYGWWSYARNRFQPVQEELSL